MEIHLNWVGAYTRAFDNISWRNETKLIIQICDAGAHGTEFTPGDKYLSEGPKLVNLIQRLAKNIIKIISFKIGSESNNSFLISKNIIKVLKEFCLKHMILKQMVYLKMFQLISEI